jgi:hypothetical protein
MSPAENQSGGRFMPLLVKGYIFGTLASAIVLHVAVALIVPGDGGTVLALESWPILFTLLVVLGLIGLLAFPAAALASWPFRKLVFSNPVLALILTAAVGFAAGAGATTFGMGVGPGDFWSGPLVGLTYALTWYFVLRSLARADAPTFG